MSKTSQRRLSNRQQVGKYLLWRKLRNAVVNDAQRVLADKLAKAAAQAEAEGAPDDTAKRDEVQP